MTFEVTSIRSLEHDPHAFCHYGVMGMKWGIRKDGHRQGYGNIKKKLSSATDKVATKVTKLNKVERAKDRQVKKERRITAAKRRILTDKELDKQLDRLKKEKQLRDLTDSEVSPGRTQAKMVLNSAGKRLAIAAATAGGAAVVTYLVTKASGKESNIDIAKVATDAYRIATKAK